jgi:phosphoribosylformimino-5-aminoimidazole carboxamide ribotide isomerase
MLIIPAIDIKEGKVVRLRQGKFNAKKIYSSNPIETARHWQRQGAKLIHLVNLDGASTGRIKNLPLVKELVKRINIPVEYGGGIRDIRTIERLLNMGMYRVVVGTCALNKVFLAKLFKRFKDKVIVSIDAKAGRVFTQGWVVKSKVLSPDCLAGSLKKIGFREVIFTDIARDGMLKGPSIGETKKILRVGLRVIASGGVSSLQDILRLAALSKQGLTGVIVGKALYEAKFTLSEALKTVKKRRQDVQDSQ